MTQGQTLISTSQIYELGFFNPNNDSAANQYVGIWYKNILPRKVVWVANREHPIIVTDSTATANLTIGSDGNLNLVDGNNRSVIWSTRIVGSPSNNSTIAVLSDDGNLVVTNGMTGHVLWQSFDHPGDTLLPRAEMGFNDENGERRVLTCWKAETDPSLGNFTVGVSPQTPPQLFVWNGSNPHWRSGQWDRTKFIGVPEMESSYLNGYKVEEGVGFSYQPPYNFTGMYAMFVISSKGLFKVLVNDQGTDWHTNWEAPNSSCDTYGVCGPFAVCNNFKSPICNCLKGFVPKSNEEWRNGNWKGGCVRRTELLCDGNSTSSSSTSHTSGGKKDGFWKKSMVKLPDLHEYVQIDYASDCNPWCQSNCSCLAYAFVNGIGCLVWFGGLVDIQEFSSGGADLFLRLAHSELVGDKKTKKVVISLAAIGTTAAIFGAIFFACYMRRRANQKGDIKDITKHFDLIETGDTSRNTLIQSTKPCDSFELSIFDFDSILVATNHFSVTNKLGQGGFGSVYKGKLHDGTDIAVKRLSSNSGQGIEELKNEMILISKLQHRNLVRLLGCCIYKEEKLIIYEFMPNKSLDFFLFDSRRRSELNWERRFNIIHGVAKGLLYLHRDSSLRVIHRDLKASNILLDGKMNPKISDFGLARIFQESIDLANTHRVVGTIGYMSPEYVMGGMFSEKSDVYSFGVLLLETVSGKRNTSFHDCDQQLSLIAHAWQLWSEGRALELMDEALLADSYSSADVVRCVEIGLVCAQDHPTDRPTMPEVVLMLTDNYQTHRPKPQRPLFFCQSSLKFHLQPQVATKCSANDATISIEGR
ncbi:hypothetical protein FNV43_RR06194 [Rhamnella rubrinervis]|uniref:Receptor-like serine/threonine-protein kinase n=1 Tax=Rhamnella rubrinervis TaxID=2594499 RepID=A0A8K0HDD5_9ROSA|nr:hypothetical protein FNV43_RR06194 [Rhamnella rubrinervis]